MISTVAATAAGQAMARRLAEAWPGRVRVLAGGVAEQFRAAWSGSTGVVCFLATGAAVRLAAPLLGDKLTDPAVVCVDEAGRYAVALLGGHEGGGNELAAAVAGVLGAEPVVTTATDSAGLWPLDSYGADLGFRLADRSNVARVSRALLDGVPPALVADATWPLPPLPTAVIAAGDTDPVEPLAVGAPMPETTEPGAPGAGMSELVASGAGVPEAGVPLEEPPAVGASAVESSPAGTGAAYTVVVSDRLDAAGDLVYRPPSLVVGVGGSRGVPAAELDELVTAGLAAAGLAPESVRALATVDLKATEPGIVEVARRRGWPLLTYPAAELAAEDVPHPSEVVRAAVGTPSVAEAAALRAARDHGRASALVLPKRASAMATVAVARLTPRGKLTIVGLGPGADDLRTPRATAALRRSAVVVGLDQYVDAVRALLAPGTRVLASGLGAEEERARLAVDLATAGHAVALIGSGDAGVYAMASPALQLAGPDVEVAAVPGVTAALASAALLGAPLGHDHAYLSLSDLHTPWPVIVARLRACAESDLVVCLYNPRSRRRTAQFDEALEILGKHRGDHVPVGVVREAERPDQRIVRTTLGELAADPSIVDMRSMVIVGSSRTVSRAGRMITPREYRWLG